MRWFRFYDDVVHDPKVQRLPADDFRAWVNLLCLASKSSGRFPPIQDIAFALRISEGDAEAVLARLTKAGLLDRDRDGMKPHNWSGRQHASDSSAERVKRHRERRRNGSGNGASNGNETASVTGGVTDARRYSNALESEQSQSREEQNRAAQPRAREDAVRVRQALVGIFGESQITLGWTWADTASLLDAGFTEAEILMAGEKTKAKAVTPRNLVKYLRPVLDDMRAGARPAPAKQHPDFAKIAGRS